MIVRLEWVKVQLGDFGMTIATEKKKEDRCRNEFIGGEFFCPTNPPLFSDAGTRPSRS